MERVQIDGQTNWRYDRHWEPMDKLPDGWMDGLVTNGWLDKRWLVCLSVEMCRQRQTCRPSFDALPYCCYFVLKKPIVITGCNLTQSAVDNWSLEYLNSQLADQVLQICVTPNRQFKYYSRENRGNYIFDPPYSAYNGTFKTFLELADTVDNTKHGSRLYFEQLLSDINVSSDMQIDLSAFNWDWVNINILPVTGWGKLQHTFLSVGKKDVTIAALYDTAENLFATVKTDRPLMIVCLFVSVGVPRFPVTRSWCCSVQLNMPICIHSQSIIHKTDSHRCVSVSACMYVYDYGVCLSSSLSLCLYVYHQPSIAGDS